MKFCVYLTCYRGNLLPPFYVGSTSVAKIQNGYGGSVSSRAFKKIWQSERKKRPWLFKTRIVGTYASRTEAYKVEDRLCTALRAARSPMYINRGPVIDAFYARGTEHPMFGRKHTDEALAKMSAAHSGKTISPAHRLAVGDHFRGKPNTEKHKAKIAAAHVGKKHSHSACVKMSAYHTGKVMSDAARAKMVKARTGTYWWTNGVSTRRSREQPGSEWKRGRT